MTSDTTAANAEIPRKSSLATSETLVKQDAQEENSFLTEIKKWINVLTNLKWFNIIVISSIHFGALYGLFTLDFTVNIRTIIWCKYFLENLTNIDNYVLNNNYENC